jgi:hypothetical protein
MVEPGKPQIDLRKTYFHHYQFPKGMDWQAKELLAYYQLQIVSYHITGLYGSRPHAVRSKNVMNFDVGGLEAGKVRVEEGRLSWSIFDPKA